jgi:hypothetical protein
VRPIAITGRAGTGKSTLAAAIVELEPRLRRASFAAELKADLAELGVQKGQPHAREVMIAYGQNRRAVCPDYWIDRARRACGGTFAGHVLDDVRFRNELAALRAAGALVVRLECDELERAKRLGLEPLDPFLSSSDPSEAELDDLPFGSVDVRADTGSSSASVIARYVLEVAR